MKLGEIKLEGLRLMCANDEVLDINRLEEYASDDRYKDYLDRMSGAINRAMSRFLTYKVIPTKVAEVKPSQAITKKQFLQFNLKEIISDFNSLERIVYIYERVVPNIEYQTINDGVILIEFSSSYTFKGATEQLPNNARVGDAYYFEGECNVWNGSEWEVVDEDETFEIEYMPIPQMITSTTDNNTELEIPESLARIIPYFIKADLYELDEPNLSANARNIFESALTEYISFGISRKQRQQYVKNTFL